MQWVLKFHIGTSRGTLETAGRFVLDTMRRFVREIRIITENELQGIPLATRNNPVFADVRLSTMYTILLTSNRT